MIDIKASAKNYIKAMDNGTNDHNVFQIDRDTMEQCLSKFATMVLKAYVDDLVSKSALVPAECNSLKCFRTEPHAPH